MTRHVLETASIGLVAFATGTAFGQPPAENGESPGTREIAALIEQLGNRRYADREAASRKLRALDDVPFQLEQAAKSANPEVASRAKAIVREIKYRNLDRRIRLCLEPINKVGFDLFVEKMVNCPGYATEERWTMVQNLADGLSASTTKQGHRGFSRPAADWATTPIDRANVCLIGSVPLGGGGNLTHYSDAGLILLTARSMPKLRYIKDSILIIVGDFDGADSIRDSLVICTGNVGPISSLENCIVLATNHVELSPKWTLLEGNFIQARAIRGNAYSRNNIFLNSKVNPFLGSSGDQFLKAQTGPLQLLKMFDPADVGLKVEFKNKQTHILSLDPQSPFAKAGLRPGDELLSINRTWWDSYQQFRTVLRKALVNNLMSLKARREKKILELGVRLDIERKNEKR